MGKTTFPLSLSLPRLISPATAKPRLISAILRKQCLQTGRTSYHVCQFSRKKLWPGGYLTIFDNQVNIYNSQPQKFQTIPSFKISQKSLLLPSQNKEIMKKDIHPANYRTVIFKIFSQDKSWLGKSAANTRETIKWEDGTNILLLSSKFRTNHTRFLPENEILLIPQVVSINSKRNTAKQ